MKGKPMFDLNKIQPTQTHFIKQEQSKLGGEINIEDNFRDMIDMLVEDAGTGKNPDGTINKDHLPTEFITTLNEGLCEELLRRNTKNRKVSKADVHHYATLMKRGQFDFIPELPFAMDWDGYLRQGGHRTTAALKSGMPLRVAIKFGCNPDNFDRYDQAKRRTGKDVLGIRDVKNPTEVTQLIRAVYCYNLNGYNFRVPQGHLSLREVDDYAQEHMDDLQDSVLMMFRAKTEHMPNPSIYGAIHYLIIDSINNLKEFWKDSFDSNDIDNIIERKKEVTTKWFVDFLTNNLLCRADSSYHLRRKLYELSLSKEIRVTRETVATFVIEAWNAHTTKDQPRKHYGYIKGNEIPRLIPAQEWKNV